MKNSLNASNFKNDIKKNAELYHKKRHALPITLFKVFFSENKPIKNTNGLLFLKDFLRV